METKSIKSVTEYIDVLKEILSVSNYDINIRMNQERMDLFNSIYFDNRSAEKYIHEYEEQKQHIYSEINQILKEEDKYLKNKPQNGLEQYNKDDLMFTNNDSSKLNYFNYRLNYLYKQVAILDDRIIILRKKRTLTKNNEKAQKNVFYYRGQYGAQYSLLPKIMRNNNLVNESKIYHEIMVNCAAEFSGLSHLDKLVFMQHYDCPTRLLDVTKNPLVALYFACKNFNCKNCKKEKNGKVYLFAVPEDKVAYSDSDRGLMLSCLPKFSKNEKNKLLDKCEEYIYLGKNFDEQCNDEIVERFLHEVRSELPAFRKLINPKDLVDSIIIQPNKSNARILRQDGAFIISGLSKNVREENKKLISKVYAEITIKDEESMENILEDLNKLGINEATLFPEVDNVAHYLQEYLLS